MKTHSSEFGNDHTTLTAAAESAVQMDDELELRPERSTRLSAEEQNQLILSLVESPLEKEPNPNLSKDSDDEIETGMKVKGSLAPSAVQTSTNRSMRSPGAFNVSGRAAVSNTAQTSSQIPIEEDQETEEGLVNSVVVSATRVDEEEADVEERVRKQILQEAVQADVVSSHPENTADSPRSKDTFVRRIISIVCFVLLVAAVVGIAIGVSANKDDEAPLSPQNDTEPDEQIVLGSTYEEVMKRDRVRCGVYLDMPGFSLLGEDGIVRGFNYELCRAVAAAALGDSDKVEVVQISASDRFQKLASRDVDLISQTVTVTMERDVAEPASGAGFTFSYPFYYSGLVFGGVPEYLECADRLDPFNGICRGLRVCVVTGTTQEVTLQQLLPGSSVVRFEQPIDAIPLFNNGTCNAIAAEAITLNPARLAALGLSTDLNVRTGQNTFSRDPLSLVTRDGDQQWSDLVNSVVKILLTAEQQQFTSATVEQDLRSLEGVNPTLASRIINVVTAVGNYEEMYGVSAEAVIPRGGANVLNSFGDTGLLYSFPYGNIFRSDAIEEPSSQTIDDIEERGFLKCGVVLDGLFGDYNETSGEYFGIDIEFCRAMAAGLFVGDADLVEFVEVDSSSAFRALRDGEVDVLGGQELTLTSEFFEPTTGLSFSFSEPYFRGADGTARALVSRRNDDTWSSFLYWTVNTLLFAEESGITSENAIQIPPVPFLGERLLQCFRDSIASVGNYGEIYEKTMEAFVPRSGANLLNVAPFGPQQVGYKIA